MFVAVSPLWKDGVLWANQDCVQSTAGWGRIEFVVYYCFRWFHWSSSRWLRCGRAARFYSRSLICGVDGMVRVVKGDPVAVKTFLPSHERSTPAIREFFVIAGMSAPASEKVLLQQSIDDRLFRFGADHRRDMLAEALKVATTPRFTWERMAATVSEDYPWSTARHRSLSTMCVSMAFIDREVFSLLRSYPGCLTQGDVGEQLEALLADEGYIRDVMARKVRELLVSGVDKEEVKAGIDLFRESACSVKMVEEGHGYGAVFMRPHSEVTAKQLINAHALSQIRSQFAQAPLTREARRIARRLAALDKKRPNKAGARQLFFRQEAYNVLADPATATDDLFHAMQAPMAAHGAAFRNLPENALRQFQQDAAQYRGDRARQIFDEELALLQRQRAIQAQRAEEFVARGKPNHLAQDRFSDEALIEIARRAEHIKKTTPCQELPGTGDIRPLAPPVPPEDTQGIIEEHWSDLHEDAPPSPLPPEWMHHVCVARDFSERRFLYRRYRQ